MHPTYKAIVIGAGPAGVSLIEKLIDQLIYHNKENASILWIDPQFNSGRLSKYIRVPSNTKVKRFLEYCSSGHTFKELWKKIPHNELTVLSSLDPDQGCSLGHVVETIQILTQGLQKYYSDIVTSIVDTVTSLHYFSEKNSWIISTEKGDNFESQFVFLATGSHPRSISECDNTMISLCNEHLPSLTANPSAKMFIDLDYALDINKIKGMIDQSDTVLVFGISHSAMLVVMNLSMIPNPPKCVIQISKSSRSFKYAVDMGDWILYDNTGLKGQVAEWTKEYIDIPDPNKYLPYDYHLLILDDIISGSKSSILKSVTRIVLAIGYSRNSLPTIQVNGQTIRDQDITYDNKSGKLDSLISLPCMFGYGIAFPEKVIDKYGNKEDSVGMAKFAQYFSRIIPSVLQK